MPRPIKLLQLTDLHLKADQSAEMRGSNIQRQIDEILETATAHPLWPADLVALTGDIVDESEQAAWQTAYSRLAQQLSNLNTKVCCIPGNHDYPALLETVFTAHHMTTKGCLTLGNWRIILLDSSVPGSTDGMLSASQLASIDQSLVAAKAEHTLVLIHHPVIDINCRWLDKMKVANGLALINRLTNVPGSKVIVWGHAHQEFDALYQGIRLLGAPAACPVQFKPLSDEFAIDEINHPGFRWCMLHDDGNIDTLVVRL